MDRLVDILDKIMNDDPFRYALVFVAFIVALAFIKGAYLPAA